MNVTSRGLAAALAWAAIACGPPKEVRLRSPQAQVVLQLSPLSVRVLDPGGKELLASLSDAPSGAYDYPGVAEDHPHFVSQIIPGWDDYREGPPVWSHGGTAELLAHTATSASFRVHSGGYLITVDLSVDGERVHYAQRLQRVDPGAPAVPLLSSLAFALPRDEHFFGMGERYATVDHRGWSLYSWAEEAGLGGGETAPPNAQNPYPNGPSMTGYPVPFFLSTRGYGLRLESPFRSTMHFGSERPDAWRMQVNHESFALTVYVSADPLEVLRAFTEDTGRPVIPAPWAFGVHRRVDVNATVNGVPEWQLMRQKRVPVTGIDDATHFSPASSQRGSEGTLTTWVNTLHANGYKVFAYNNPYVSATLPGGADDFAYGVAHDYFVKGPDGKPSLAFFSSAGAQSVAAIDFTNPPAADWYKQILNRTLTVGYDGWMQDFGEYIARDARFFDGRRGDEVHNLFPVMSAKATAELLNQARPNDSVFFVRSGYTGTQAYAPMSWGSDAEATFDNTQGLPAALRGGLDLGLSGMPYWGSDISGYKCFDTAPRDKEVYLRWVELGVVSPWWKEENSCTSLFARPAKWTLWSDDETIATYAKMASLHTRLQPYFLVLAQQAAATGVPLMRHPVLLYPEEPGAWATDDAFFLGPALYAAPVVRRGQTWRDLWLPPGRYLDLDDSRVYTGGTEVFLPAPLLKLPLLLKEGQLLPLLDPAVQTLAPATDPSVVTAQSVADRLDVVVVLAVGSSAQLTLADGTRLSASRGAVDQGNPGGLQTTDEAGIAGCALCLRTSAVGDVDRLQANSALASGSDLSVADLVLRVQGGPIRRVRWDVQRLR